MTVYFTSDPHWGHKFVAQLRGFDGDTSAHDAALLENFQRIVKRGDQVWWLGDLAMGNPEYALAMTAAIDGEHHLITGNHDFCFPGHRESHKWQKKYLEVFKSVQPYARRRVPVAPEGYHEVLLSHFPYIGGDPAEADHSMEPRYTQYRLPDEGRWLLHGHTHHADQRLHGHQIHVGLDAHNMRPVSLEYVSELIYLGSSVIPTLTKGNEDV
jgi:calcineurin-like phosphoesterase family protein